MTPAQVHTEAAAYLKTIIRGLVRGEVEVRPNEKHNSFTYLDILVDGSDMGLVIGRQGRMFDALLHIMKGYSGISTHSYVPRIPDGASQ